jgi:hypothetical protein
LTSRSSLTSIGISSFLSQRLRDVLLPLLTLLRLVLPCLLDPPGRFPFHQMGHPRLPRYLWPLEQVFQPPRFSFGIVSLRRDNSAFTKSFPREHSSPRSSQVIEVVTLFPAYCVAPKAPKFNRLLPQPYSSSPKAARAFVTTAISHLAYKADHHGDVAAQ